MLTLQLCKLHRLYKVGSTGSALFHNHSHQWNWGQNTPQQLKSTLAIAVKELLNKNKN